jgi:hypothetical protein
MKQIIQDLKKGNTILEEVPALGWCGFVIRTSAYKAENKNIHSINRTIQ